MPTVRLQSDVRILVTGATGFVGAALARALVERGAAVTVLARPSSSHARLHGLPIAIALGDVTDAASLAAPMAAAQAVFHVAGLVSYRTRARSECERVNVLGTRNVMEVARRAGVARVVHTSSVVAVGAARTPRQLDESAEWDCADLKSPYFDTKRAAEDEVRRGIDAGLDAVIVNPSAVIGPGEPRGNLAGIAERLARGKRVSVPPGGVNIVALGDVVAGHLLAMERGARGERYLLAGENVSWKELVSRVARVLAVERPITTIPRWLYSAVVAGSALADRFVDLNAPLCPGALRPMARFSWFTNAKAIADLGWRPGDVGPALAAALAEPRERARLG